VASQLGLPAPCKESALSLSPQYRVEKDAGQRHIEAGSADLHTRINFRSVLKSRLLVPNTLCKRLAWSRASDEYVYETAGALLPAGDSRGVEDADERAKEVVRIGVRAQLSTGNGAFDRRDEGSVNETARAFDQSHRASRDGVHGRDDERFRGHMIDEEKHPNAERFKWWQSSGETLLGCGKLFDFAAVDGFDEGVARWKMAIEGGVSDSGSACNVVKARSCPIASEDFLGYLKDAFAITLRIGAGLAGRRG
jgi:hypothetical protein